MTKLEKLALDMNNACMFPSGTSGDTLVMINQELARMALEESQCPPYYLSDEDGRYENSPSYVLHFQILSTMWAQVYARAATECTLFKTLNQKVES